MPEASWSCPCCCFVLLLCLIECHEKPKPSRCRRPLAGSTCQSVTAAQGRERGAAFWPDLAGKGNEPNLGHLFCTWRDGIGVTANEPKGLLRGSRGWMLERSAKLLRVVVGSQTFSRFFHWEGGAALGIFPCSSEQIHVNGIMESQDGSGGKGA